MGDANFGIVPVGMIGMTGYEQYASQNQLDRFVTTQTGHPDAAALTHLSRTLYIPRHDAGSAHFAIYDISPQYAAATRDLAIGSGQYVVALARMQKPRNYATDSTSVPISYEVDFSGHGDGEAVVGLVRSHDASLSQEMKLTILTENDKAANLVSRSGDPAVVIPLRVTYPHPPSTTRTGTFKHPYFSFQIPDDPSIFEWQIHPSQQGYMRYTLVRRATSDQRQQQVSDSDIQAIYFHIGVGSSLSLSYSEGVLLFPTGQNSVREALFVASALGMLRRLRELRGDKSGKEAKKKSCLGALKGFCFGDKG